MQHSKQLIVLCFIALTLSLQAQEWRDSTARHSGWWAEGGASLGSTNLLTAPGGSLYVGVNKRVAPNRSFGILLQGYHNAGTIPGWGIHQSNGAWDSRGFNLMPNLTWDIPITSRISWTPRAYASIGFNRQTLSFAPTASAESCLSTRSGMPLEVGVKPASFALKLSPNVALNLTFNFLNVFLNTLIPTDGTTGIPIGYGIGKASPYTDKSAVSPGLSIGFPLPERFKKRRPSPYLATQYLLD